MIVTPFRKGSLFERYAAYYEGIWGFGPTRIKAIGAALAQIAALQMRV